MGCIRVMSDVLASQVAAGEVVERPASVVKELVENSIDAEARTIAIDIQRGGISLIKVTDDGVGMAPDDAVACFERHATSKLTDLEGLFEITHLGFRGEALPSIASVSRLKLSTRQHDALEGTEILVQGGEINPPRSSGISPGTSIEVHELFYNTPARRQFLKSQETESGHIDHQIRLHSLAYPGIRFIFRKDSQTVFDLPGTHDLRSRIALLQDRATAEKLIAIPETIGPGVTVSGYLLPLSEARRNRKGQFFFLNHRPIDDQLVTRAVRDGFGGFPNGLHPVVFLFLEVEPALVDVNVHPAKREVRFRRPSDLISTIIEAISHALSDHARGTHTTSPEIPEVEPRKQAESDLPTSPVTPVTPAAPSRPSTSQAPSEPLRAVQLNSSTPQAPILTPQSPVSQVSSLPTLARTARAVSPLPAVQRNLDLPDDRPNRPHEEFKFIGMLQELGMFESKDGLVFFNPKAALERILFEELLAQSQGGQVSQLMLDPVIIELDPRDYSYITSQLVAFERAGMTVVPFGQRTIRVESIPASVKVADTHQWLRNFFDELTDNEGGKRPRQLTEKLLATQIAHRAVLGEQVSAMQIPQLLEKLLSCEVPYCTPTGQATMNMYSMSEIRRKFK